MKAKDIGNFLKAGYPFFWVDTAGETDRCFRELVNIIEKTGTNGEKYIVTSWDVATGGKDVLSAIKNLIDAPDNTIGIFKNFHWFIENPAIVQMIQNNLELLSSKRKAMIVLSPVIKIPLELNRDCTVLDFDLPDEEAILQSIAYISESAKAEMPPSGEQLQRIIRACKGLTTVEIENVLARSLVEKKCFHVPVIISQKSDIIRKSGFLEMLESEKSFDDICGFDQLKTFARRTLLSEDSKGLLLLGPPGCGKTLFMQCLSKELGIPAIVLDLGRLYGKFVGESDQNVRLATKTIEAFGDCIVIIDEFEKQFAGASGEGGDHGTARRVTGHLLTWMQDRPKGIRVVGTCNSFIGIPPEYLRAGRWDSAPFFIDLPNDEEKEETMKYYLEKYNLDPKQKWPEMQQWTGAEIETCVRLAKTMDVKLVEASRFVLPQAKTMKEEIDALRKWADGRTIPATSVKLNGEVVKATDKRRRQIGY